MRPLSSSHDEHQFKTASAHFTHIFTHLPRYWDRYIMLKNLCGKVIKFYQMLKGRISFTVNVWNVPVLHCVWDLQRLQSGTGINHQFSPEFGIMSF